MGEVLLWQEIKARRLGYQLGRFIVDFYCSPLKLVIEIDGSSHDAKVEEDIQRQKEIERLNIHFLRFTERDARSNLESVLHEIKRYISKIAQPPLQ